MEFGSPSQLKVGRHVVGLSWASPSASEVEVSNWLIATTESNIAVFASDGRPVHSWLTRPGSYNSFTIPAVQNRYTRRFFCIQNGDRLFSWYEKDPSLEGASRTKLRGPVFALRTAHEVPLVVVVFVDGGISAFNDELEEVVHLPAPGDGTITTWTRFARVTGDDSHFMLLTLQQQGEQPTAGQAAAAPYIAVHTVARVAAPAAASGAPAGFVFKRVATHPLLRPADGAPAPGSPPCRIASITLHKLLRALSILWSDGTLQVLQFSRVPAAWIETSPMLQLTRRLARFVPGGDAPSAPFHAATFALEPSCLVIAGQASSAEAGMSVWDARFGVLLGSLRLQAGDGGANGGKGKAPAGCGAGQAPGAAPGDVLQVTVSEDNSFVAVASRERVWLAGVAVRGASLLSAVGGMQATAAMLVRQPRGEGQGGEEGGAVTAPLIRLSKAIRAAAAAAAPAPTASSPLALGLSRYSEGPARAAWTHSAETDAAALRSACDRVQDHAACPDGDAILAVLQGWTTAAQAPSSSYSSSAAVAPAAGAAAPATAAGEEEALGAAKSSKKRRRAEAAAAAASAAAALNDDPAEGAAASCAGASSPDGVGSMPLPPPLCDAALRRVSQALLPGGDGPRWDVTSLLLFLMQQRSGHAVSSLSNLGGLLALLVDGACAAPSSSSPEPSRKGKRGSSSSGSGDPPAGATTPLSCLLLLEALLRTCPEVPETAAIAALQAVIGRLPAATLSALASAAPLLPATPAPQQPGGDSGALADGLLRFVCAMLHAKGSDGAMLACLAPSAPSPLTNEQLLALLACLLRLLQAHSGSAAPPRALPLPLPPLPLLLDWVRLVLDARMQQLMLALSAGQAGGADAPAGFLAGLVRELAAETAALTAAAGSLALVAGAVSHLLARAPMPVPPQPAHVLERVVI